MLISAEEFAGRLDETKGGLWAVEDRIVLGDCLTALRHMPDCTVDLIHTSPPYNIDKAYKGEHGDKRGFDRYLDFLRLVIAEMRRVLRPNGSLFWQTGYTQIENGIPGDIVPIDMLSYQLFKEEPNALVLWDRIIWRYFGGMAFKRKYTNRHETILWFVKPLKGAANPRFDVDSIRERSRELDKRNNFWGRNPGNVWEVDRVAFGSIEQSSHIAVYPEEIAEKIIRASSRPGDLVLDPFCGSGTTPKVARSLARHWIGIEISPEYARECVRRIGFQQPNEVNSLASAIIKEKIFAGRRGSLPAAEVSARLVMWAKSVQLGKAHEVFARASSRVFGEAGGKEAKPLVWEEFERVIEETDRNPVAEADQLLVAEYKNRRNQNGVLRYRTALEILEALVQRVLTSEGDALDRYVEEIAVNEPSSYTVSGGIVELTTAEKRIKPPERAADLATPWMQGVLNLAEAPGPGWGVRAGNDGGEE